MPNPFAPVLSVLPPLGREGADDALRAAATAVLGNAFGWRRTSGRALVREVSSALGAPDPTVSYVFLACLQQRIPRSSEIVEFTRSWRLDGVEEPLLAAWGSSRPKPGVRVVVASGVVVDVTETGRSAFTTGIQRVTRESVTRWVRDHDDVDLVSWDHAGARLAGLTELEASRVVLDADTRRRVRRLPSTVVVPYRATFVLPEITTQGRRSENIRTIARYSRSRAVAIGHDCIPVTTSETAGPGMAGAFSKYLAALAGFDVVASVSNASATEFRGWAQMLGGAGLSGPRVVPVPLPRQSAAIDDATVARVTSELGLDDGVPTVLAVGSHEPRKNHLTLLAAAELRWRAGDEFHLVLVGGNAWGDADFTRMVEALLAAGRPISLLSAVGDDTVWSLYRIARLSVFCSLNEGFGLPVVESLASGTPVLTSDFGSMRELGEGHGAVLVDPYDVHAIARELGSLLEDDARIETLRRETGRLERSTWDDYAKRVWELVEAPSRVSEG
ncbi:glycosyltransferase family 4 protein [Frondihabitans cladoniiphilus]|uniref:Glycosyl transferase family 1 domain-containing protein n=1 Tax=Frondihabitans cladoniiphilus TaxID=715785 RepID=A0ABP8WF30_9MICO